MRSSGFEQNVVFAKPVADHLREQQIAGKVGANDDVQLFVQPGVVQVPFASR